MLSLSSQRKEHHLLAPRLKTASPQTLPPKIPYIRSVAESPAGAIQKDAASLSRVDTNCQNKCIVFRDRRIDCK